MGSTEIEVLTKQYEQAWQNIRELDKDYIKVTLLYITLIGVYIGTFRFFSPEKYSFLISVVISLFGLCIIGVIYRTRRLIDWEFIVINDVIDKIRKEGIPMIKPPKNRGLDNIRTSTCLSFIVILLTGLAVFLLKRLYISIGVSLIGLAVVLKFIWRDLHTN